MRINYTYSASLVSDADAHAYKLAFSNVPSRMLMLWVDGSNDVLCEKKVSLGLKMLSLNQWVDRSKATCH